MQARIITVATATFAALAAAGCDSQRRSEERAAQAATASAAANVAAAATQAASQHAARVALLRSTLQEADAAHSLASQQLAAAKGQETQMEAELAEVLRAKARLKQQVSSFMLNHKMAVAVLAAGAGGTAAALDDTGQFTAEARQLGAVAGALALLYALGNMEEVIHVASQLADAEQRARMLDEATAALNDRLAQAKQDAVAAQAALDAAAQRALSVRAELQGLG